MATSVLLGASLALAPARLEVLASQANPAESLPRLAFATLAIYTPPGGDAHNEMARDILGMLGWCQGARRLERAGRCAWGLILLASDAAGRTAERTARARTG